ncbi:4-hydroxy-tetrahydrodipicolinate reductase [Persicobacter psychrovividus]|uniref:4-hydroxy-tetrahydrodipicolinate reductase n=1 Tax=Persicobacter psychrovividus TaxID=387638 RepID=A0ABN6L665_9BACT|nr:4-hydroxy-tetrahydrodipicolinate reductase [Persicobacter psychrovividus]
MRIALLGYGKMGKIIESIAISRGHQIVARIDKDNAADLQTLTNEQVDVAIEFSMPAVAFDNLSTCIKNGIPVLSGTTGWLDKMTDVENLVKEKNGTFFYASNYSIGVNLFFKINDFVAKLMNPQQDYKIDMEEIHHTEKLDAPSGTAITLAEGVINHTERKEKWVNNSSEKTDELSIISLREPEVPGTHSVHYRSEVDTIEIKHTAHSRQGFALGAVLVAEWLPAQKGMKNMDDFLKL